MTYRAASITGGVICGVSLLCLDKGPGGFNTWSVTCATLMVLGFVAGLVFHVLASRERFGTMADEAGMRHKASFSISVDSAFEAEPQGIPLRFEFQPPQESFRFTTCRMRMDLGLPSELEADVSGKGVLSRDLDGLLRALPRVENAPSWLEGFGVYGRPEALAREAFARIGGLEELKAAGWNWSSLSISRGRLLITASSSEPEMDGAGLRELQDACVRVALRTTGRA